MRFRTISAFSLTCVMSLWSSTALAQASDEGAAELLAVLKTYLGTTEGVVAVEVDGDAYAVNIDVAPLLAKIPTEGLTSAVSPIEISVTDNGDGTWAYEMDQPVSIEYATPGVMTNKTAYEKVVLSGVFDESLGDSSSYKLEMLGMIQEQTQTDASGEIKLVSSQDSMVVEGTAASGANGLDSSFTAALQGLSYAITGPASEGMPPMDYLLTLAGGRATGGMTGYQPAAFYGLLAWFVAHPDAALIEADKAGLKSQLEAALPLFQSLKMAGAYQTISATSPVGVFGIEEVGFAANMNGVVADGKFREALSFKGFTMPEGLVPPFAIPLVPSEFSIDLAASKFDLAAAAALALGLLDLPAGAAPPAELESQILAALLPEGTVEVTLAPGTAKAPAYGLTYEGAVTVGPALPLPVGKARIGLTGIAAINEALAASPPEMGLQDMAGMLGMAEIMAKPGTDGELVWEVEATAAGGLLVNGQDMMGAGQ